MDSIHVRWNIEFDKTDIDAGDGSIEHRARNTAVAALELLNDTTTGDPDRPNIFNITIDGRRVSVDLGSDTTIEREIDDHPATSSAPQPPREYVQASLAKLSGTEKAALASDLIHSAALSANLISDDTGVTELINTLNDYVSNNWF